MTPNTMQQQLIVNHLGYANKLARLRKQQLPAPEISIDDLRGAAYLGLVEAARNFDQEQSDFATHARHRVQGAMSDYVRSQLQLYGRKRKQRLRCATLPEVASPSPGDSWWELLEPLPPKAQQLLTWKYVDRYSHKEIAQRLGTTPANVAISLHRHLNTLRSFYGY